MQKQQINPSVTIPKLNPNTHNYHQTCLPSLHEAGFPMTENKMIEQTSSRFNGARSDQVYNPIMLHNQRLTATDLRLRRMELVIHIQTLLNKSKPPIYNTNDMQIVQQPVNDAQTLICAAKLERRLFDASKCIEEHFNIDTLRERMITFVFQYLEEIFL